MVDDISLAIGRLEGAMTGMSNEVGSLTKSLNRYIASNEKRLADGDATMDELRMATTGLSNDIRAVASDVRRVRTSQAVGFALVTIVLVGLGVTMITENAFAMWTSVGVSVIGGAMRVITRT